MAPTIILCLSTLRLYALLFQSLHRAMLFWQSYIKIHKCLVSRFSNISRKNSGYTLKLNGFLKYLIDLTFNRIRYEEFNLQWNTSYSLDQINVMYRDVCNQTYHICYYVLCWIKREIRSSKRCEYFPASWYLVIYPNHFESFCDNILNFTWNHSDVLLKLTAWSPPSD